MVVPLTIDGTNAAPGTKFYFPETPVLENKNIVGLEGHLSTNLVGSYIGDLDINTGSLNVNNDEATYLFFTIFDENGEEKFSNVPFASICKIYSSVLNANKKRVYPFVGKIKTRKSFFTFPPNLPFTPTSNFVVSLTFFYNQ